MEWTNGRKHNILKTIQDEFNEESFREEFNVNDPCRVHTLCTALSTGHKEISCRLIDRVFGNIPESRVQKLDSFGRGLRDSSTGKFIIFQMRPQALSRNGSANLRGQSYNIFPRELYPFRSVSLTCLEAAEVQSAPPWPPFSWYFNPVLSGSHTVLQSDVSVRC